MDLLIRYVAAYMSEVAIAICSAERTHHRDISPAKPSWTPYPRVLATKGDLMTKSGFSGAIPSDISARRVVRSFIY